ncbi:MAG: hypothetical protein E7021_03250 [Alphaproteobacteria bacterium]|nr:hypothetical protein [Alphaproteobacteria bacterium]
MNKKFCFLIIFLLAGCSYTKPVITKIKPQNNQFIVEKCQIKYHPFVGISTENCADYSIP